MEEDDEDESQDCDPYEEFDQIETSRRVDSVDYLSSRSSYSSNPSDRSWHLSQEVKEEQRETVSLSRKKVIIKYWLYVLCSVVYG